MQSAKETGSNMAASAKAGMEKTKAALQEKGEKITSHDPLQKEMATEKKDMRMQEAERQKQQTRDHNAAAKQTGAGTGGVFTNAPDVGMGPPHPTGADTTGESVLRSDLPQSGGRRVGH